MTKPNHLYSYIRDEIHAGPLWETPRQSEEENGPKNEGEA
jgi:hypothetical protein